MLSPGVGASGPRRLAELVLVGNRRGNEPGESWRAFFFFLESAALLPCGWVEVAGLPSLTESILVRGAAPLRRAVGAGGERCTLAAWCQGGCLQ